MSYTVEIKQTGIGGHIIYSEESIQQVTISFDTAPDYSRG